MLFIIMVGGKAIEYNCVCVCVFQHKFDELFSEIGPFPSGEWSMFIPPHYTTLVMPWLKQNRGNFSLLLHTNTGYMRAL